MSDSEKGGLAAGLAHAAVAFAGTPFPYLLGCAFLILASHWDGHLYSQSGCFQLQEIKGKVYKFDTCSGKTEKIDTEIKNSPSESDKAAPTPPNAELKK